MTKNIVLRPLVQEDVQSFLNDCLANCRFHWGIFLNNRHVGNVSCSAWSNKNHWIDVSYIIGDKNIWGRSVATLSVGAVIDYLFSVHHYNKVQAHSTVDNSASIKVMKKLGMRQDAVLRENAYFPNRKRYSDEVIYSVLCREWDPKVIDIDSIRVFPMPWEKDIT